MSLQQLDLPSNTVPKQSYNVVIEDKEYKLSFTYLTRQTSWYFSISDVEGNLIVSNVRLVPNIYLLTQYQSDDLPKGDFIIYYKSYSYPSCPEITFDNLYSDFELWYFTGAKTL